MLRNNILPNEKMKRFIVKAILNLASNFFTDNLNAVNCYKNKTLTGKLEPGF